MSQYFQPIKQIDNDNLTEPLKDPRKEKVSFDISGPTVLGQSGQHFYFRASSIMNNNTSVKLNPLVQNFKNKTERPIRWFILVLAVFVIMGTEYCYYNPMPIEEEINEEMQISGSKFNFLFTVYSLPNIIAPLFAGLLVGKLGPRLVMFIFLTISLTGQIVNILGVYFYNYSILVIGRILLGIGSECVQVGQSTIVSMWYGNKELSLAMGISLAFPMLGGSINDFLTPIIYKESNELYICFIAGFVMLVLSMIGCIIMIGIDKNQQINEKQFQKIIKQEMKKEKEGNSQKSESEEEEEIEVEKIDFGQIKQINKLALLILILSGLSVGLIMPFMDSANNFAQVRFKASKSVAGLVTALPDAISAFCTPFLGFFVDTIPKQRTKLLVLSFVLFLIGHLSMGIITCDESCGYVYFPFILLGISFTSWYSIVMPTIPLAVEEKLLGTCFGLSSISQHTTISIYVTILGFIKDHYQEGNQVKGYGIQNLFFIFSGILCLGLAVMIYLFEQKSKVLKKSIKSRSLAKSSLMPIDDELKALEDDEIDNLYEQVDQQNTNIE